ncbi:MAG: hypothetical protein ACD_79C01165G0001, partial [uncultured bacterium]
MFTGITSAGGAVYTFDQMSDASVPVWLRYVTSGKKVVTLSFSETLQGTGYTFTNRGEYFNTGAMNTSITTTNGIFDLLSDVDRYNSFITTD